MMTGKRIKSLRLKKKITQKELANVLNVSESAIGMYERGEREPNYETLNKIAEFFNTSSDYLLGRSNDSSPSVSTSNGGRAFLGGADSYTEEELDIANAAAQAAIEALRKSRANKKQ